MHFCLQSAAYHRAGSLYGFINAYSLNFSLLSESLIGREEYMRAPLNTEVDSEFFWSKLYVGAHFTAYS